MKNTICKYCEEEIIWTHYGKRSDIAFHDDTCRMAYHNEQKAIDRLERRIMKALGTLSELRDSGAKKNRSIASEYIEKIAYEAVLFKRSGWMCANCNNFTQAENIPRKCSKCAHLSFIAIKPSI